MDDSMKNGTQENDERITRREITPRCRHHDCVCARAAELAGMGMTKLALEIHMSEFPVRCRRAR